MAKERKKQAVQDEERVLALVNRIREGLGTKPLKRLRPGKKDSCPVNESLGKCVNTLLESIEVNVGEGCKLSEDEVSTALRKAGLRPCKPYVIVPHPTQFCSTVFDVPKYFSRFIEEMDEDESTAPKSVRGKWSP